MDLGLTDSTRHCITVNANRRSVVFSTRTRCPYDAAVDVDVQRCTPKAKVNLNSTIMHEDTCRSLSKHYRILITPATAASTVHRFVDELSQAISSDWMIRLESEID